MECTYCGSELGCVDFYGKGLGSDFRKEGDIYKCVNWEGFETKEEAEKYALDNDISYKNWEDLVCDSEAFSGFYYTDRNGDIYEGYPC